MTTIRMRALCAGLILTATLAFVALMPTAVEYAVMAGISLNAID
jgi:hypothetical protein